MKLKNWLFPTVLAVLVFALVRPAFAQIALGAPGTPEIIGVGSEVVGGYHQIYYETENGRTFITQGSFNSTLPDTDGKYVVYRKSLGSVDQIFLFDSSLNTTTQLTSNGNNTNPKVDAGRVVWERWESLELETGSWVVYFFDGITAERISDGGLSANPDIDGDYIVYGNRDSAGTWRSLVYSIANKENREISTGLSSQDVKLEDGKIILSGTGVSEEFPLTVDDIFLLDFEFTETVEAREATEEEIRSELDNDNDPGSE